MQPALIQVVPPGQGGVFDYMQCLKSEWATLGQDSQVVVLSRSSARERSLFACVAEHCRDDAPHCAVVLHYSGYGYGRRGLCGWLLDELRLLRLQRQHGLRLVLVFHELFATGPPWRSAFWLSPVQALIAARAARSADALWTNTEHHARWLRTVVDATMPIFVQPVFSNVGEATAPLQGTPRRERAVVFGSSSTRQRAFDGLRSHEAVLRRLGVEELLEVGPGPASASSGLSMRTRHAGRLERADLRRVLLESRFGLLDYPSQCLGKSGVFAAYAAHGCVVVDTCRPGPDTDELLAGVHYLSLPALAGLPGAVASSAANAARASLLNSWYGQHSLRHQATELLALATL